MMGSRIATRESQRYDLLTLVKQCLSFWESGQAIYPGALFADSDTETVEEAARRILEVSNGK